MFRPSLSQEVDIPDAGDENPGTRPGSWAARKRVLRRYFPAPHRAEAGEAKAEQREGGGLGDRFWDRGQ